MAQQKLKHYIVWYSILHGTQCIYRSKHKAMEKAVNTIINDEYYEPGSLKVIVGVEVLSPDSGQELL